MITYETILASNVVIEGRVLRELLPDLTPEQFTELINQHYSIHVPNTPFFAEDLNPRVQGILTEQNIPTFLMDAATTAFINKFLADEGMCASEYATNALSDDLDVRLEEYLFDSDLLNDITRIASMSEDECRQRLAGKTTDDLDALELEELRQLALTIYA